MRSDVGREIKDIIHAPNKEEAENRLRKLTQKYKQSAPKLAQWAEKNIPESFAFFQFPAEHWSKIRTSNVLERVNREIRRRTRVINVFPNADAYLRLVSAMLMDISEKWLKESRYMPQAE